MRKSFIAAALMLSSVFSWAGNGTYKVTALDEEVLRALLIDDVYSYLTGGDPLGNELYKTEKSLDLSNVTNAARMAFEYKDNELKGDRLWKGKRVVLNGLVKGVKGLSNGDYYIEFVSYPGYWNTTKAILSDSEIAKAENLVSNQEVTLTCIGDGLFNGSPVLKHCVFLDKLRLAELLGTEYALELKRLDQRGFKRFPEDLREAMATGLIIARTYNYFPACKRPLTAKCISSEMQNDNEKYLKEFAKGKSLDDIQNEFKSIAKYFGVPLPESILAK